MAFGTITSTSNTFGSVDGTTTGVIPGTLSGSVGVPGPQGPAGATGAQGPAGAAGVGVPAGGTTGQALVKTSNSDYATSWTTISLTQYLEKANNLSDLTNVTTARSNLGLGTANTPTFLGIDGETGAFGNIGDELKGYSIGTAGSGDSSNGFQFIRQTWVDDGSGNPIDGIINQANYGDQGLLLNYRQAGWTYKNVLFWDGGSSGSLQVSSFNFATNTVISSVAVNPTSITFPNSSVQTIAFPGFNNVALTGNPTAPTAALGDNDTSIATTAFVQQELLSGTANARNLEVQVRNQSGSTIPAGSIVYISGATGNLPLITLAQANNDANSAQTIGFVKTSIANNGTGYVIVRGILEAIDTQALTEGVQLYLSPTTAGTWTTTKPSAPQHMVYVGIVIRSHPTLGTILVSVQNGLELEELHNVAAQTPANNDLLAYELSTDLWKNKTAAALGLAGLNSPVFSGSPSLPTGTTAVTQTAGNNTTAVATTAFVTASNPDASTTVKGHVELATDTESQNGSSTTLAMTPSTVAYAKSSPSFYRNSAIVLVSGSLGTGAAAGINTGGFRTLCPTSASGYGMSGFLLSFHNRSVVGPTAPFDWSKRFVGQFRYQPRTLGTDANTVNRVCWGKTNIPITGDLSVRGVGIKQAANGALILQAHNGTILTSVTSSVTPTATTTYDVRIVSDGAGNVTLFVNDSQAATTSAGPTNASGTGAYWLTIESENLTSITGTSNSHFVSEITTEFSN